LLCVALSSIATPARGQSTQRGAPSVARPVLDQATERAIEAQRTADRALERADGARDAADRRFDAVEKLFYLISLVGTVFLIGSAVIEARRRQSERDRFDLVLQRQDKFDRIAINAATQQGQLVDTQIELGNKVLLRSDEVLQKQIETMSKLGAVIELVENIFRSRLDQEKGREDLQTKLDQVTKIVDRQTADSRAQMETLVIVPMLQLAELTRMEWPRLGREEQAVAQSARMTFRSLSGVTIEESVRRDPLQVAQVCCLLGVSAYYANDVTEAFRLLVRSRELYDSVNVIPAEHRKPAAFCFHYLGVLEKNWWRATRPFEENLQESKRALEEADKRLRHNAGEFLTPLTLIEVLSYIETERVAASKRLADLLKKFAAIPADEMDANQKSLKQRAHLLQGNLELFHGRSAAAVEAYASANGGAENHFALLSMGLLASREPHIGDATKWLSRGLTLLIESGALDKQEVTTRASNLAWAAVAAHAAGDPRATEHANRFFQAMGHVRKVGDRVPLFFDPASKMLVTDEVLLKAVKRELGPEGNQRANH
jgi:hypothetical protein